MNEHEIGREVQELGSRLERIEASLRVKPGYAGVNGDRGSSRYHKSSGGVAEKKPVEWKLKKGDTLPPLLSNLMRLPHLPAPKFDDPPQRRLGPFTRAVDSHRQLVRRRIRRILSARQSDLLGYEVDRSEYRRRVGGRDLCRDTHSLGQGAHPRWPVRANFQLILRGPGGTPVGVYNDGFWVDCNENDLFLISHQFNPGLYDLVTGVSWNLSYSGIGRC